MNKKDIIKKAEKYRWEIGEDFHDAVIETIYKEASLISEKTVTDKNVAANLDFKLDKILTSRIYGFPIMLALLSLVFWLTIQGANIPSAFLSYLLVDQLHGLLKSFSAFLSLPYFIDGMLIDGAYLSAAWVVSVMLPPMAIFFPLFTLLEDFGYLPRVAFNLDGIYKRVGAHGKQALTMTMGFGCNAAGVVASRIIDSPRERLIAIITNNFSLCNGRWPTQILIATIFIGSVVPSYIAGVVSSAAVIFVAILGVIFSFAVSWLLSNSWLKGEGSSFSLELPPYRPPRFWQTIYTSLIDRTLIVLWRAVVFAAPAGVVIWLVANVEINNITLAKYFIDFANPFGILIGLNGIILLAYIIAIPANEIVLPTILMLTTLTLNIANVGAGNGVLFETDSVNVTAEILRSGGWTTLTGISIMLFSLLHNPCSTTIYTIYKETKSIKWTLVATFLPVLLGIIVCFFTAQVWRIFAG